MQLSDVPSPPSRATPKAGARGRVVRFHDFHRGIEADACAPGDTRRAVRAELGAARDGPRLGLVRCLDPVHDRPVRGRVAAHEQVWRACAENPKT